MKKRTWLRNVLLALPAVFLALAAHAYAATGVPIVFSLGAGIDPTKTYLQFISVTGTLTGYYYDSSGVQHSLAANTAYAMSTITSSTSVGGGAPTNVPAIFISSFPSGRVYINYGTAGLSGMSTAYQPSPTSAGDANYTVRYQYFEPTIATDQINVDLSYIDFTSIPMSLAAINAPHASNNPQTTTANGVTLVNATASSGTTALNNVLPSPSQILPNANFTRIVSPSISPGSAALYHDWTNYLQTTLTSQQVTLKGYYVGTGTQPAGAAQGYCLTASPPITDAGECSRYQAQSYDYIATFDSSGNVTLTPQSDSGNGSAACVPVNLRGSGIGSGGSITISFANLNTTTGIYGNNPIYSYSYTNGTTYSGTTTGLTNDIFGRVVGDLVAGLSFGFPGSTVQYNGTAIGALASTQWWGGILPDGTIISLANTPAGNNLAFGNAQPGQSLNYHTYSASLNALTSAYGFALQDRLNNNTIAFNTTTDANSYLKVTINSDNANIVGPDMLLLLSPTN